MSELTRRGYKFRAVVIPTLLAFISLGSWLESGRSGYVSLNQVVALPWGNLANPTSLALSLTANALVTGLIILKVFREVQAGTSDDQLEILGATGGNKLRRIILVLIDSGMTLFSIQLALLVITIVQTGAANRDYHAVSSIYNTLIGITPAMILVRTFSVGLSFHDKRSMGKVAIRSLRFASNHPNSVPEMGSISMVGQDSRADVMEVSRSYDFDVDHDEYYLLSK